MRRTGRLLLVGMAAGAALSASAATSADLFVPGAFSALAGDRHAARVGDSLTIIINQSTSASNTATATNTKSAGLGGLFNAGNTNQSAQLGINGQFGGSGETGRTDKMVAQLSVTVDAVLPNGDLHVSGSQLMTVNGEKTHIKVSGRVRLADISSANSVPSTSLADAVIEYNGKGFAARSAQPGVIGKIASWLGLL